MLNDKLNEVIGEGILDSILPFICAASNQSIRNTNSCANGKGKTSQIPISKDITAEKSTTPRQSAIQDPKKTGDGNALLPIHKDRNVRRKSSHSLGIHSEWVQCIYHSLVVSLIIRSIL